MGVTAHQQGESRPGLALRDSEMQALRLRVRAAVSGWPGE